MLCTQSMPAEPATFVFADIAGFTALTEAHGDEQRLPSSTSSARESMPRSRPTRRG